MIKIECFTFNPFSENTYVVSDHTGECIIIDPGCADKSERKILETYIQDEGLRPVKVINTHCHVDHVLGNQWVKQQFGIPLEIPEGEKENYSAVINYAPVYGFPAYSHVEADALIPNNSFLQFGETKLEVLFVPGHSPGHQAFWHAESLNCIAGDVLFDGSIGRTDLPGGDFDTLIQSIHKKIFALPDKTIVHCGHGPSTTVGKEKRSNPFCRLRQ